MSSASTAEITREQQEFLKPALPSPSAKVFVTLTYAQSRNGLIAGAPGKQSAISGPESKAMTHYMRSKYDGIMVGRRTVEVDDPSLNCRYPGATKDDQPRPIVISARFDPWEKNEWYRESKIMQRGISGESPAPWLVRWDATGIFTGGHPYAWADEFAGTIIYDKGAQDLTDEKRCTYMKWESLLEALGGEKIKSLMIEGGANVINDLLKRPDIVDTVIITTGPNDLPEDGVRVDQPPAGAIWDKKTLQFGDDIVTIGRLSHGFADGGGAVQLR